MEYPFDWKLIQEHLLVPSFGFPGADPPRVQDGGVLHRAGGQLLALVTPLSTPATSKSTGPIEKTITDPESAYFYRYLEMLHTFQGEFLFFLLFHGQPPLKKLGKNGLCPGGARFGPEGVHFMKTSLGGTCRGISWAAFLKGVSNLVQASARCSLCSCSDQGKQFRSALTLILEKEKNVTNIICRPVLHGVRTVDLSEIEGRGAKLQRFWVRAPKKT